MNSNSVTKYFSNAAHILSKYSLGLIGFAVCLLVFKSDAFPSLYGDEYASLRHSDNLLINIHSLGYLLQLAAWRMIGASEVWLRLLSALWGAVGVWGCWQWGKSLGLSHQIRWHWCALLLTNAFFVSYQYQVRFYSFYVATAVLFFWQSTELVKNQGGRKQLFIWMMSAILFLSSMLIGWIVFGFVVLAILWYQAGWRNKTIVIGSLMVLVLLLAIEPVRDFVTYVIRRMGGTDNAATQFEARGFGIVSVVKIFWTSYLFVLGRRVYPFWFWVTVPAAVIASTAFVCGLVAASRERFLKWLIVFLLLSVLFLYLIFEPLVITVRWSIRPHYVIYFLPLFILILVLGTRGKASLLIPLWLTNVTGLLFLLFAIGNYGEPNRIHWAEILRAAIPKPEAACVISDRRSKPRVLHYVPKGTVVSLKLGPCRESERILFLSSDFHLHKIQHMDALAKRIDKTYGLVSNQTQSLFQMTVYEKGFPDRSLPTIVSRIGLEDQDLTLPLKTLDGKTRLKGYVRLNERTRDYEAELPIEGGELLFLSNYLNAEPLAEGTTVFEVHWIGAAGEEMVTPIRAGIETSSWNGECSDCTKAASWKKKFHFLGGYYYPQAYRQYEAKIWSAKIKPPPWKSPRIKIVRSEQVDTAYFWGILPAD